MTGFDWLVVANVCGAEKGSKVLAAALSSPSNLKEACLWKMAHRVGESRSKVRK